MLTSIRDLLDQLDQLAARGATEPTADDAVAALGQLARALSVLGEYRFAAPGVFTAAAGRRQLAVRELAAAAGWAAHCGSPGPSTAPTPLALPAPSAPAPAPALLAAPAAPGLVLSRRMVDCAGAAADLIARRAPDTDADARWAAACALAASTQHVAAHAQRFPPYSRTPELVRVTRLTRLVGQLTGLDPPSVTAAAWLDRPVGRVPAIGTVELGEAITGLVEALATERAAGTLTVCAVLAAAAAAETAAMHAARLAETITRALRPGAPQGAWSARDVPWRACPDAWRVVQAGLVRFDDGARLANGPPSRTTAHAVALQHAVITAENPATQRDANGQPAGLAAAATSTRYLANQLPEAARAIGNAVRQWAIEGRLMARARNLPRTERRVTELLRDQVVIVAPTDVDAVLLAARVATRLSAALAVELDRTTAIVGHQPQPGLVAGLARLQPARRIERDADWAHTVATHPAASHRNTHPDAQHSAGTSLTFSD